MNNFPLFIFYKFNLRLWAVRGYDKMNNFPLFISLTSGCGLYEGMIK